MTTTSARAAVRHQRGLHLAARFPRRSGVPPPPGVASATGPATRVTSAPCWAAAAASANPILPDERLPRKRTSSTASWVGPAVTTTRRPASELAVPRPARPARPSAAATISAGSTRRPAPIQPQASSPRSGPTVRTRPVPSRRRRLSCTSGCSHMLTFIAGASSTGARLASTTAASRSSAIPAAKRAMASAVAGATMIRSASSARRMWPISDFCAEIEQVGPDLARPTGSAGSAA